LKKVIYYGLLFFPLKDHHNIKEELGERTEEGKRDPLAGERGPDVPAQGPPVGTAVSQGKCLLQAYGSVGLMGRVTFGLSQDLVNETCHCAYNTCEIHFRTLLIKNN
jgi:hypothetical protein